VCVCVGERLALARLTSRRSGLSWGSRRRGKTLQEALASFLRLCDRGFRGDRGFCDRGFRLVPMPLPTILLLLLRPLLTVMLPLMLLILAAVPVCCVVLECRDRGFRLVPMPLPTLMLLLLRLLLT
jgi:hypothetical protein